MNLKVHLLLHIVLAAFVCLAVTTSYVLYRSDRQNEREATVTANSVARQLEMQLLRINAGFGVREQFPDLSLWKQTRTVTGICIRFISAEGGIRQDICRAAATAERTWPEAFAKLYRRLFNPGREVIRPVSVNGDYYGSVGVNLAIETELARAWNNIEALAGLTTITVACVCLLVYLATRQMLRPAGRIVEGLEKMRFGDLRTRLPRFHIDEWQRTAEAINALAAAQQQLLAERKQLTVKLMALQEEERRFVARELHDELGQSLAAINAIAASVTLSASEVCPSLLPEVESIQRINRNVMEVLHHLLSRMRPAGLDELGLEACLKTMIAEWRSYGGNTIDYRLTVSGDCRQLPEPLPIALFRIVQECLTNIAKHSGAKLARVELSVADRSVTLKIEDDGNSDQPPFANSDGIGLPGIRERVVALGGELHLETGPLGGFAVHVSIPWQTLENIAT